MYIRKAESNLSLSIYITKLLSNLYFMHDILYNSGLTMRDNRVEIRLYSDESAR